LLGTIFTRRRLGVGWNYWWTMTLVDKAIVLAAKVSGRYVRHGQTIRISGV
jgi:hypothetical protein